jgi:hypothetical protein
VRAPSKVAATPSFSSVQAGRNALIASSLMQVLLLHVTLARAMPQRPTARAV